MTLKQIKIDRQRIVKQMKVLRCFYFWSGVMAPEARPLYLKLDSKRRILKQMQRIRERQNKAANIYN